MGLEQAIHDLVLEVAVAVQVAAQRAQLLFRKHQEQRLGAEVEPPPGGEVRVHEHARRWIQEVQDPVPEVSVRVPVLSGELLRGGDRDPAGAGLPGPFDRARKAPGGAPDIQRTRQPPALVLLLLPFRPRSSGSSPALRAELDPRLATAIAPGTAECPSLSSRARMSSRSLFLRKVHAPEQPGHDPLPGPGLKRTLTAFDLTLLGIGAIIGAGLFSSIKDMITGTAVLQGAGPAVVISYLLTAMACGFAALCYAEIAAMVPVSGSAYSYSYVAFGELVAWIIGWDLMIEYAIGNVYVAASWADYFQTFLHGLSGGAWQLPVWLMDDFQSATQIVQGAAAALADPSSSAEVRAAAQATLDAW